MSKPTSKDIWKGALESLSPEERQQLKPFQDEKLEVLSELVRIAEQKRTEAQKKRWKFTHHGRTYIVRDYLEKIIVWVEKFKAVGDVAVQYDPAHAALPWACVRFFLQVAVDNVNTFGVIVQSLSQIVNIIAQSTILEALYLSRILKVTPLLERSLTRLYALILRYLSNALRYYSTGTAKNLVKGIFTESSQNISEVAAGEQNEIQRLATIAEAEMRDLSNSEQNLARTQQTIELKSILSDLKVPISRIQADMSQMMRLAEESERLAILKSLSTIPYPSHHQTAARGRLKESGEWLLRHPAFVSWRGSSSSTILWLHGIPGCGKTKLCSVVIDSMKPARTPAGSSECLAFFYCARDPREPLRGQCSAILQSLLRQIVSMAPARTIPKPVKTAYQQIQDEGFGEREWRRDECVDTIVQLMDIYPSITIIIDALDECDTDERMDLLIALKEVRDNSANLVKIFISSRDDVDIFTSLADASDIRISADDNEEDIGRFVQEKVDALMNNREKLYGSASDGLRREMMSVLSEKAQGMFRWVDLQLETLKRTKMEEDLRSQLGHLPETLDQSYYAIYCTIRNSGTHAKILADGVFQWLLYGQKTIETEDFAEFVSLATGSSKSPLRPRHVLDICSNLVEIDQAQNVFRFVHLSVREFFERYQDRGDPRFTARNGHAALAYHSLRHICLSLDPVRVVNQDPQGSENYLTVPGLSSMNAIKLYVDRFWLQHTKLSGEQRREEPFRPLFESFIRSCPGSESIYNKWCRTAVLHEVGNMEGERCYSAIRKPAHQIWLACAFDLAELVDVCCLDASFDIEMKTGVHLTPLLEAARLGSPGTLRRLIEMGADARTSTPRYNKGVLEFALENGHQSVIEQLLDLGVVERTENVPSDESDETSFDPFDTTREWRKYGKVRSEGPSGCDRVFS